MRYKAEHAGANEFDSLMAHRTASAEHLFVALRRLTKLVEKAQESGDCQQSEELDLALHVARTALLKASGP